MNEKAFASLLCAEPHLGSPSWQASGGWPARLPFMVRDGFHPSCLSLLSLTTAEGQVQFRFIDLQVEMKKEFGLKA